MDFAQTVVRRPTTPFHEADEQVSLSLAQQRIIRHRGRHLQVIACAGSGKTETISRRIAELVAEGVAPGSIVAFTFTRAAAESLKSRVLARVLDRLPGYHPDRLSPMYLGTIHAWCLRLLQQHSPRHATFDLFEDHQVVALCLREYKRLGLDALAESRSTKNRTAVVNLFLKSMDVLDNELLPLARLPDGPFRRSVEQFRDMLEGYHVLTHNQCIARCVESLAAPDFFAAVHGPLRHLVVDEFQDINPAQAQLIERLAAKPVELCVVGDDDQSIYQWRGSDVGWLQRFQQRFGAVAEMLDVNRRSRRGLVRLTSAFAERIDGRLPKTISASRDAGPLEVTCFVASTADEEAQQVADAIVRMHQQGLPYASVAILLRSVSTSSPCFTEALSARGIPWRCSGTAGLFMQNEAWLLARAFACIEGRDTVYETRKKANVPCDAERVGRDAMSAFGVDAHRVQAWLERARSTLSQRKQVDLVGLLYEFLEVLGIAALDPMASTDVPRLATVARFSKLLADFQSATRRLRRVDGEGRATGKGHEWRGAQSDFAQVLRRFNDYVGFYAQHSYEGAEEDVGFDVDAVTISTVHQAKGLEWPVVFIPCLTKSRFPSPMTGQVQSWLVPRELFDASRYEGTENDERRLMYVAATRARDHLYLSRHERAKTSRVAPSPYFEQLGGKGLEATAEPLPVPRRFERVKPHMPEKPTLGLSELVAWLRCPRSYRLRTELGFEPSAAKELGYGKAVHHVLRRVAEETMREGRVPAQARVDALFEREFFLPYADRPSLETMRAAAMRLVRKYVEAYRADLERTWAVERPFELHLEHAHVQGRADVVVMQDGGLALVDYKTSEGSEFAHLQLAAYAAGGIGEGLSVREAWVHDLKSGSRERVAVDAKARGLAVTTLEHAARGIRQRRFEATPGRVCSRCDVAPVCQARAKDSAGSRLRRHAS